MSKENPRSLQLERVWWLALTTSVVGLVLFYSAGFRFSNVELILGSLRLLLGACCSWWLLRYRPHLKFGAIASGWIQHAMIALGAAMIAFWGATLGFPLADPALLAMDQTLLYDWKSYVALFAGTSGGVILLIAYHTLVFQPVFIVLALAFQGKADQLARYQVATLISLLITISLFAFYPATTAWAQLGGDALSEARRLDLIGIDAGWVHDLMEIRAGGGRLVSWDVDARIIGFPSFHCAGAIVNCWALWDLSRLRWWIVGLNVLLIAATPIIGGHYLVDLLAGGVVALAAILLATRSGAWPVPRLARWIIPTSYRPAYLFLAVTELSRGKTWLSSWTR